MTLAPDLPTAPVAGDEALAIHGLTKRFGATTALDRASLVVRPGTVHALLGGNGSGKSTTIKVLAGVHQADAGRLAVGGREHDLATFSAADARAAGLRFVHQDLGLFSGLSVAENVALDAGYPVQARSRVQWRELHRRVGRLLHEHELDVDPRTPIDELRPAERTMVAIARALQDAGPDSRERLVLVLDEPTASLAQHESAELLDRVRRLADTGQTVVMVSHRMSEVLSVADDFTVFLDGRTVATLTDASPTEDELVELMAGRAVEALRPVDSSSATETLRLRTEALAGGPLRGVDLALHAGEIVGVAGLVGSGRSSLLRMLFGDLPSTSGTAHLDGSAYAPTSVADAMARGVALVPEDRGREAAFAPLSVADNLSVTRLRRFWGWRGMDRRAEYAEARRLIADFKVKVGGPEAGFTSMSGGNQQKVVLARWLQRDPTLLLLDEPTQGVDVMSRVDIYRTVREAARRGSAVLVASSDASELLALCDRILILREGRVDEDLTAESLHPDDLTRKLLRATSVREEDR
ncbi:sugar ABC transporter ATP-binding protein [Nocardioides flavescens]|uniref:ATP-binding cassette domain-containing protein n=1 Tax=Nocardioides flavescens TaxID=2691959 RepID=A0A6L7EXZ4_9ACTN|nr:sugar ABC transporter ATP-binding protein [Nocardioides flavescens]MXG88292.1 ATP-binding cassette domain-containing protein [Nocardioides flavescens]